MLHKLELKEEMLDFLHDEVFTHETLMHCEQDGFDQLLLNHCMALQDCLAELHARRLQGLERQEALERSSILDLSGTHWAVVVAIAGFGTELHNLVLQEGVDRQEVEDLETGVRFRYQKLYQNWQQLLLPKHRAECASRSSEVADTKPESKAAVVATVVGADVGTVAETRVEPEAEAGEQTQAETPAKEVDADVRAAAEAEVKTQADTVGQAQREKEAEAPREGQAAHREVPPHPKPEPDATPEVDAVEELEGFTCETSARWELLRGATEEFGDSCDHLQTLLDVVREDSPRCSTAPLLGPTAEMAAQGEAQAAAEAQVAVNPKAATALEGTGQSHTEAEEERRADLADEQPHLAPEPRATMGIHTPAAAEVPSEAQPQITPAAAEVPSEAQPQITPAAAEVPSEAQPQITPAAEVKTQADTVGQAQREKEAEAPREGQAAHREVPPHPKPEPDATPEVDAVEELEGFTCETSARWELLRGATEEFGDSCDHLQTLLDVVREDSPRCSTAPLLGPTAEMAAQGEAQAAAEAQVAVNPKAATALEGTGQSHTEAEEERRADLADEQPHLAPEPRATMGIHTPAAAEVPSEAQPQITPAAAEVPSEAQPQITPAAAEVPSEAQPQITPAAAEVPSEAQPQVTPAAADVPSEAQPQVTPAAAEVPSEAQPQVTPAAAEVPSEAQPQVTPAAAEVPSEAQPQVTPAAAEVPSEAQPQVTPAAAELQPRVEPPVTPASTDSQPEPDAQATPAAHVQPQAQPVVTAAAEGVPLWDSLREVTLEVGSPCGHLQQLFDVVTEDMGTPQPTGAGCADQENTKAHTEAQGNTEAKGVAVEDEAPVEAEAEIEQNVEAQAVAETADGAQVETEAKQKEVTEAEATSRGKIEEVKPGAGTQENQPQPPSPSKQDDVAPQGGSEDCRGARATDIQCAQRQHRARAEVTLKREALGALKAVVFAEDNQRYAVLEEEATGWEALCALQRGQESATNGPASRPNAVVADGGAESQRPRDVREKETAEGGATAAQPETETKASEAAEVPSEAQPQAPSTHATAGTGLEGPHRRLSLDFSGHFDRVACHGDGEEDRGVQVLGCPAGPTTVNVCGLEGVYGAHWAWALAKAVMKDGAAPDRRQIVLELVAQRTGAGVEEAAAATPGPPASPAPLGALPDTINVRGLPALCGTEGEWDVLQATLAQPADRLQIVLDLIRRAGDRAPAEREGPGAGAAVPLTITTATVPAPPGASPARASGRMAMGGAAVAAAHPDPKPSAGAPAQGPPVETPRGSAVEGSSLAVAAEGDGTNVSSLSGLSGSTAPDSAVSNDTPSSDLDALGAFFTAGKAPPPAAPHLMPYQGPAPAAPTPADLLRQGSARRIQRHYAAHRDKRRRTAATRIQQRYRGHAVRAKNSFLLSSSVDVAAYRPPPDPMPNEGEVLYTMEEEAAATRIQAAFRSQAHARRRSAPVTAHAHTNGTAATHVRQLSLPGAADLSAGGSGSGSESEPFKLRSSSEPRGDSSSGDDHEALMRQARSERRRSPRSKGSKRGAGAGSPTSSSVQ